MPIDYRFVGDVAIVGNVAGVIADATHFDAARDLDALLDRGCRHFIFELRGVGAPGPAALGLLMTLTRIIRQCGGEVVFARVGRGTWQVFEEMQMDAHWELYRTVAEALDYFRRPGFGSAEAEDGIGEP